MYDIYKSAGVAVQELDSKTLVAFRAVYDEIYRECSLRLIG
jgi:hypothetical protein